MNFKLRTAKEQGGQSQPQLSGWIGTPYSGPTSWCCESWCDSSVTARAWEQTPRSGAFIALGVCSGQPTALLAIRVVSCDLVHIQKAFEDVSRARCA